eukprot:CAMPEP_0181045062 /NCGR_PEP_ID=MMETSP1070-20121207/13603_1 /TAXON_ID=265543 /ORGANISM="Minutocellus polymorphus, Strain NH13" /LENGTH=285 /DNA_ID=CAMNT_0023123557 /DNA_START=1 /DNA_END=861 /DNA_ORIENTATION=-
MAAGKKRSRKPGQDDSAKSQKKSKQSKGASSSASKSFPTPTSLIENESIDCIASPFGLLTSQHPIRTPLFSSDDKDILIDRLKKEVVDKFDFTLSRKMERNQTTNGVSFTMGGGGIKMDGHDETNRTGKKGKKKRPKPPPIERVPTLADLVVKSRFVVGVNQCTRALEAVAKNAKGGAAGAQLPSLVLLSRDVRPPTIVAHIPVLCQQLDIPAAVLPGRASVDLGKAVGGRSVAVAMFLPRTEEKSVVEEEKGGPPISESQMQECHRCIDSYVKFALSKVPSSGK